jgi:hypothetical protein
LDAIYGSLPDFIYWIDRMFYSIFLF